MRYIIFAIALLLSIPVHAETEVAFSPHGGATQLVVKVIDSAQSQVLLSAYQLTSPPIAEALVRAKARGVDVRVVCDRSQRVDWSMCGPLGRAGVPVRINGRYKIAHDKITVVDQKTVETGSFNYTASAEGYNAENVIVLWNEPAVAAQYARHWSVLWNGGESY